MPSPRTQVSPIGKRRQTQVAAEADSPNHVLELVAVIGKTARNVKAADALVYVAGYSIGLDIAIRGPEKRSLRKSPTATRCWAPG